MGQYYYPIVMNREGGTVIGSFYSHSYDHNGLKLMEHSYLGNGFVNAVLAKAMAAKEFTLAWIGDYSDIDEDIRMSGRYSGDGRDYERIFLRAKRAADNGVRRIEPDDPEVLEFQDKVSDIVVYDLIRKEKISLRRYKAAQIRNRIKLNISPWGEGPETLIIHPIPLLTAIGNGKGGGDYADEGSACMEWVSLWALHPLMILTEGDPDPEGEWKDISEEVLFEEGRDLPAARIMNHTI